MNTPPDGILELRAGKFVTAIRVFVGKSFELLHDFMVMERF